MPGSGDVSGRDDMRRKPNMLTQPDVSLHSDMYRVYDMRG